MACVSRLRPVRSCFGRPVLGTSGGVATTNKSFARSTSIQPSQIEACSGRTPSDRRGTTNETDRSDCGRWRNATVAPGAGAREAAFRGRSTRRQLEFRCSGRIVAVDHLVNSGRGGQRRGFITTSSPVGSISTSDGATHFLGGHNNLKSFCIWRESNCGQFHTRPLAPVLRSPAGRQGVLPPALLRQPEGNARGSARTP